MHNMSTRTVSLSEVVLVKHAEAQANRFSTDHAVLSITHAIYLSPAHTHTHTHTFNALSVTS